MSGVQTRHRYSIGQFAKMTGLSVKTLRYYDEEGILKPAEVDRDTGYRQYLPHQVDQARTLCELRFLHVPVDTLRAYMADPSAQHRLAVFDQHIEHLEREVAALNNRLRTMKRKRAFPWAGAPYQVGTEEHASIPFVYMHYQTLLLDIEQARESAFETVRAYLVRQGVEPVSPPLCFYPPGDMNSDERSCCEVYSGFAVGEPVPVEGRLQCGLTPGGTWYVTRHTGLYEYMGRAFAALDQTLRAEGYPIRQMYGQFVMAEVFYTGPWDTDDLGALETGVRWLLHPQDTGSVQRRLVVSRGPGRGGGVQS